MCGITGFYGSGSKAILERMTDSLRYRGPDDRGVEVFAGGKRSEGDGTVGLGHRRLSIIDLSPAGHQPMRNEDGTVWIVFNGEIYNFHELKSALKQSHIWKGGSDTELIIHLYEEVGTDVFSLIHGMFAIAIYDSRRNPGTLILARDRMGKKPLYWSLPEDAARSQVLIFGSELKALMQHPLFKKELDLESLNKYFLYENIPTPHSIFKNTWKLEPGTYLTWNGKTASKKAFWKPTFLPKAESFKESLADLDAKLRTAVKDRLMSDVPLGVFLSGGLDSSTIAYYAATAAEHRVKTFSIGFKEASFDESEYARRVASHLGTEHHEKILSVHDCLDILPAMAASLDEPMADPSIIPTYLLSKFARQQVTVALGGDGGDELFSGYDTFLAHRVAKMYEKIPKIARKGVIEKIVRLLPPSSSKTGLQFRAARFVKGFDSNPYHRDRIWFAPFDDAERSALFNGEARKQLTHSPYEDVDAYLTSMDSKDFYDGLALMYERLYMMDEVLVKVDRASMMNSLEVRAPFLDTRVVDAANHMPTDFKLHGLTRKYILKKLMEGKLPHDIIYRPKRGFGMPVARWLRGDLKPLILDVLGKTSIQAMEVLNPEYVNTLVYEHMSGRADHRKQLWSLLVFALWWRNWMKQ